MLQRFLRQDTSNENHFNLLIKPMNTTHHSRLPSWTLIVLLLASASTAAAGDSKSTASATVAAAVSGKEDSSSTEKKETESESTSNKSAVTNPTTLSGTKAPVQSSERPFDLNIAGPVQVGGSDKASKEFMKGDLQKLTEFVNTKLNEKAPVNDATMLLNPEKLFLKNASDVRVYFVGEGAGFQNSLGYNTDGGGVTSGNPELIFPNATSQVNSMDPKSASGAKRTSSEPLLPGDFVELGTVKGGTKLDFFLIANGALGGKDVFSTDQSVNPDAINHVVAFSGLSGSYLLIGFEDLLKGGDRDFNDVLIAVEIGAANLAALTATPEPATLAILPMFLGLGWWAKRRRDQRAA